VQAETWRSSTLSEGSAFFLGDANTLVTAAHVIPDPVVKLTVVDGLGTVWPAQLMGLNRDADVAMLRVPGMSPLPLQVASHPLAVRSRVYVAGNPGGGAPGTVVRGVILNTSFHADTDGGSIDHAYQIRGGPVGHGMSGGPVLDAWGKVVGVLDAATDNGLTSVAIPIKEFLDRAGACSTCPQGGGWRVSAPMYVGPPLITTASSKLVLPPSYFGRPVTQNGNEVFYSAGSQASGDLDEGHLWVEVFPSIKEAQASVLHHKDATLAVWTGASVQAVSIGDGGTLILYQHYGFKGMEILWTERNAQAGWWIETIGWDASKLFGDIADQQQIRLAEAR
jgi:S1-C subfamily serine protease